MTTEYISYEFPLNERMRVFIRLEQLFLQLDHFLSGSSIWDKRAAVSTLVDILQVFSRHDLKAETLKELERHSNRLNQLSNHEGIDTKRLRKILDELNSTSKILYATNGKIDISSMKSDLFHTISQRSSIPGGTCSFDLPSYHFWLEQNKELQDEDLNMWINLFSPIRTAVDLILNFIRLSGATKEEIAHKGFHQATLDQTQPYQIVIIKLLRSIPYFVEISGGKHRFTTRFMSSSKGNIRPKQAEKDVNFLLSYCIF
ncbi:cell division protein ZapD [Bathymodiolus platifrons methanotrophic gill symbiont]|uniref:cell division protein ZapD n=1 Tax=Bathymodiolus platifrons methanotrophic gill symbiont TaxID=113268 RepID=UPI000B697E2F|nr:cell division protein ZapD [Bathymodiolus platifrons methanotrophic gill symbiont]GAW86966.1 cell division protein ZapD [Bathymodiolus platifrons methanotrophic gill symbiont]